MYKIIKPVQLNLKTSCYTIKDMHTDDKPVITYMKIKNKTFRVKTSIFQKIMLQINASSIQRLIKRNIL